MGLYRKKLEKGEGFAFKLAYEMLAAFQTNKEVVHIKKLVPKS